jgi:UDP-MurNAc hydroxylase
MKVTLLGHASVFIEMGSTRCLMDPVFLDPFEDAAVVSCPRRSVDLAAIPPIDLLVISHSHLDHFDIPSLAHIAKTSRNCDVLCPEDKPIVYALDKLGFKRVHPEKPMKHFAFGEYELLTTPSFTNDIVEFGVVFKHKSGTFWNQVDSRMAPGEVPKTLAQAGRIDLLFAMYASQNFNFFESRGTGFPHAMHAMNLSNVMATRPRMVVPGSAGFRFAGAGMEWCNAFLFPMSRERFVADLARLAPNIEARIANPGDVFEIHAGAVVHRPAASRLARTLEDDSDLLRFDPTATIPPLTDPNPNGFSNERLLRGLEACLDAFTSFVRGAYAIPDAVVDEYRAQRASYTIGVIFPDGVERGLRVELGEESPSFVRFEHSAAPSDAGHRIVASALAAWMSREKSYFYLRAFSRKWSTLYALSASESVAVVEAREPRDLLAHYLVHKAEGADLAVKHWLDFQLKPYLPVR